MSCNQWVENAEQIWYMSTKNEMPNPVTLYACDIKYKHVVNNARTRLYVAVLLYFDTAYRVYVLLAIYWEQAK